MRPSLLPPLLSSLKIPGSSSPVPRPGPAGMERTPRCRKPCSVQLGLLVQGKVHSDLTFNAVYLSNF